MNNVNPQPSVVTEIPYEEPETFNGVHPLVDRALASAMAWALAGSFAGLVGATALMGALRRSWEEIVTVDLFLVGVLFLMVASYFIFNLFRLNAQALAMVVMAIVEVVWRRELARRAEAEVRLQLAQSAQPSAQPAPSLPERVVTEYVSVNKPLSPTVTMVGKTEVLNEDIITFLWRVWESNGQAGKGLTREYWIGKSKDGATLVAPYVFQRPDGSVQECSREYFEALVDIVDKRLRLVEGRKGGHEGKLRESPERMLTQLRWI